MNESVQYVIAGFDAGELFPLLLAFVFVIAKLLQQMAKRGGNRQAPPPRPPPAQPIGRAKSAEDELRSFLEQIAGGQPARPSVEPPPQPRPAPQTQDRPMSFQAPVQGAATASAGATRPPPPGTESFETRPQGAVPVPKARPQAAQPAPQPVYRTVRAPVAPPPIPEIPRRTDVKAAPTMPPAAGVAAGIARGGQSRGSDVLKRLRRRKDVQDAILLREILGDPIALRKPGTQSVGPHS